MTYIINLSTTHDYSINETVAAFAQLCKEYSNGCLQCFPGFFQNWTNYKWVELMYQWHYTSLIEPYKLGNITTDEFLDNLSQIFYFMNDLDKEDRNSLLIGAWNASIRMSEKTQDRLAFILQKAASEPVYLISNTNELNMREILNLFKKHYPDLKFNPDADLSTRYSDEPIELLPNVFVCLSYRFGAFKEETVTTVSLLENVVSRSMGPMTLVSQFPGDRAKAKEMELHSVLTADEFYESKDLELTVKKIQ
jgi:hypothetical protein